MVRIDASGKKEVTMAMLFEPTKTKTMILRNRFVRSATVDNSAESGYATEKQIKLFKELAEGRRERFVR